ncbi:hypothetical protein ACE1CD_08260 [Aerosakkonema sp. BLCC-F183]|uniref:hypothetical protein n=1 Tax=Aerosakkonema sp. BLCC-F183 TaxID=3342834 RepID=UPI0035BAF0CB
MTDRQSIRKGYEEYSVKGFYEQFGDEYRNPHEVVIQQVLQIAVKKWQLNLHKVLDLACGSGEVTLALKSLGATDIDGIDPYTYNAYLQRTGQPAERYTFEEVASGILCHRHYTIIICSFALHLVAESRLPLLAYQLSLIANSMVIITPHKRPQLKPEWGWICLDEILVERVRSRLFSTSYSQ